MGDTHGEYSWAANTVREPVFGDEPFAKLRWECRETLPHSPLAFSLTLVL